MDTSRDKFPFVTQVARFHSCVASTRTTPPPPQPGRRARPPPFTDVTMWLDFTVSFDLPVATRFDPVIKIEREYVSLEQTNCRPATIKKRSCTQLRTEHHAARARRLQVAGRAGLGLTVRLSQQTSGDAPSTGHPIKKRKTLDVTLTQAE